MTQPAAHRRPSITDVARGPGSRSAPSPTCSTAPTRSATPRATASLVAIEELAVRPQRLRPAAARGDHPTVGAIVLDIANPFFTEVARGVEDRLAADEYTLMLSSSDEDPEREAAVPAAVRGARRAGRHGHAVRRLDWTHLLALRDRGIDVVLLDHPSPVDDISSVAVDDVRGGGLAVEHLVGLGHTRIAFLNGPHTIKQCVDRHEGVLAALAGAGLDPAAALVEITVGSAERRGRRGRDHRLLGPTATGRPRCSASTTSPRSARCARCGPHGVAIPAEMAVVGYDDVVVRRRCSPCR